MPGLQLPDGDQGCNTSACHFVAAGSGSSIPGEYADNRTMGEKVKDALPGTGRGGSTTGQGYGQEGRGLTSGTGTGKPYCFARKGQELLRFCLGSTAWNHAVQLDAALCGSVAPLLHPDICGHLHRCSWCKPGTLS